MNRRQRRLGIRGSRAHVSRMAHRKKPFASIATHLAVWVDDTTHVRVVHPAWAEHMRKKREVEGAHPEQDAGQGGQR